MRVGGVLVIEDGHRVRPGVVTAKGADVGQRVERGQVRRLLGHLLTRQPLLLLLLLSLLRYAGRFAEHAAVAAALAAAEGKAAVVLDGVAVRGGVAGVVVAVYGIRRTLARGRRRWQRRRNFPVAKRTVPAQETEAALSLSPPLGMLVCVACDCLSRLMLELEVQRLGIWLLASCCGCAGVGGWASIGNRHRTMARSIVKVTDRRHAVRLCVTGRHCC